MNSDQNIEDSLWGYIDNTCGPEEKSAIQILLGNDPVWQEKFRELLQLNEALQNSELEVPSVRFTKNVMEEIAKYQVAPAAKNYISKKIVWGISAFFLVMISGILIYVFAQVRLVAPASNAAEVITKYNPGNIEWNRYFNNTYIYLFIMINIILGLVFFDKYLHGKKRQSANK